LFPGRMKLRAHDWTPGPCIERRTTMGEYIGLDVSLKETALSGRLPPIRFPGVRAA
jgi:transposase